MTRMPRHGEFRPTTWAGVLEELYTDDFDGGLGRHRSPYVFRGMTNSSWEMLTSLMRLGGAYENVERHLIRNFRKYAHRDVIDRDAFWYWLSVAQHHGLPTRLLDWTYSPFVALHFATDDRSAESMSRDGVVWCAHMAGVNRFLPPSFRDALAAEGSAVFTVDMLSSFEVPNATPDPTSARAGLGSTRRGPIRNLQDFDAVARNPFAVFFEPPSLDDRIVNQFALFSVISSPTFKMDDWFKLHPKVFKRVIIPASLKWEVRDKLDQANITERVIYPGLDGLSRWLGRHYSAKTTVPPPSVSIPSAKPSRKRRHKPPAKAGN